MARVSQLFKIDEEYVKSGRWKCGPSPTGAHHWIEVGHRKSKGLFLCKWCLDSRHFPTTFMGIKEYTEELLEMRNKRKGRRK